MSDNNIQTPKEELENPVKEMDAVDESEEQEQATSELLVLQESLEEIQAKAEEYLDGWQRARAEFANYKKRIERDQALIYQNATASVVKRYLVIIDDLERALAARPQEGDGAAWAAGIELIYRKLLSSLDADGVKEMQVVGEQFDPLLHEAIMQEPSQDHESGQIIEVLQKGYQVGDRVLRPAMVRVAE
jgi:molecular chaperone GrpE